MSLLRRNASEGNLTLEVNELKQALIDKHQLPNEGMNGSLEPASDLHTVRVKDWVQDQEKQLGIKVEVIASLDELSPAEQSKLTLSCFPKLNTSCWVGDRLLLLASAINTQKQAMDAYEQTVVGRFGVSMLLGAHDQKTLDQVFCSMGESGLSYLNTDLGFQFDLQTPEQQRLAVGEHIARLASIARKPDALQRRMSWYRSVFRKVNPNLIWTHDDLCVLIQKARRKLS